MYQVHKEKKEHNEQVVNLLNLLPPPVQTKTPEPDREQVGMTAQRKTEQTKKQQKASLTGTSLDDGGKTVLGG